MRDPKQLEKGVEVAILTTPIRLNMNNFMLEKAFNMFLELNKYIKHIRFALNEIKPSKTTISINETDIVIMTTNRGLSRTQTFENTSSRGYLTSRLDSEKGS
jgi:hypothetical protein